MDTPSSRHVAVRAFVLGRSAPTGRRQVALLLAATLAVLLPQLSAPPVATAEPGPVRQPTARTVTADGLPTAQINGVVWSQVIAGNTVFAGGQFTSVRPAGSPEGTGESPRSNLMSYDIRTGVSTAFAPTFNGPIQVLALSPDAQTLYVGGQFTLVDGARRDRIAAFSVATGELTPLAAKVNSTVRAIAVIGEVVYFGGNFSQVNGVSRSRLAAVRSSTGALTAWAPAADDGVQALVVTPDQTRVVVGGNFGKLGTTTAPGMGAVDASTGAVRPWRVNTVVKDYGDKSAILALSADEDTVYGSGYTFGRGEVATGNFEGVFAANPQTSNLEWLQDCHGDTYDVEAVGDVVYSVGHAHFCSNIGGFPDTTPRTAYHRALAVTKGATGTVNKNTQLGSAYGNFAGQAAPSLYNWFPALQPGTFTKLNQSAWDVEANADYVALGGEFTHVNKVGQQGLVRFALPAAAPNKVGPGDASAATTPRAGAASGASVALSWTANWDRDDQVLTYEVLRNNVVVKRLTATSQFWRRPRLNHVDRSGTPGVRYSYRIRASDPDKNTVTSPAITITYPSDPRYAQLIKTDGATHHWRLGSGRGQTTDPDSVGQLPMVLSAGVQLGTTGALTVDANRAAAFTGSSTAVARTAASSQPATARIEAWFKAAGSTSGGALVGFGGTSATTTVAGDRRLYLDAAGHLRFAVHPTGAPAAVTLASPGTYRTGTWHQVVAVQSGSGIALYVDGTQVAVASRALPMPVVSGVWTLGGTTPTSLVDAPTGAYLGGLDEVSVASSALSARQVHQHYKTGAPLRVTGVGVKR